MAPKLLTQKLKCPQCQQILHAQGQPGQQVILNCPNCGFQGSFRFPGAQHDHAIISVQNLSKSFKDVHAVQNLSFSVQKGEIYGLLGPNGAGKTTTIKLMLGLIHPDSGTTIINGHDIKTQEILAKHNIGFLPERFTFYENLTPLQTIQFFCELKGVKKSVAPKLIEEVGLQNAINRKVGTFSKGMVQLLGIAQALVGNPDIFILDEPTSGLDARWIKIVREKIKMLNDHGATIIFSSHNLTEVENLCNRVGIMNQGRLVAQDTVENLGKLLHIYPRLEITIPNLNGMVPEILTAMDGIQHIEAHQNILSVSCAAGMRSQVIASLEKMGFKIENLKTIEPSLEEAFVRLVSQKGDA